VQLRFADQSHFGAVFKRLASATPKRFRNVAIAQSVRSVHSQ
jgi:AraC-like DNA-binding protein